jgi:tRNA U38,U39,U40 pseudouridine synthase TruA
MRFCFIRTLSYLVDAVVNGLVNSVLCLRGKHDFVSFRSGENSRDISVYVIEEKEPRGNVPMR